MGRGRHYSWWRRHAERAESLLYRGGWAARLAFSAGLQGRLRIDHRDFVIPAGRWTEPLRVAFASDLHAGPLTDPRLFRDVFTAIDAFAPHLVLLGGDYVSLDHRHVASLIESFRRLEPPLGTLAVLGNHDLWVEDAAIVAALESAGVTVLVNQSCTLSVPFQDVVVFGLDEPSTGAPDASRMSHEPGKARLVLMHSPLGVGLLQGRPWHLAFCGHTHGGQVALPGGIPIVLPRGSGPRRYSHGHFSLADEGGGQLLVSRGVGMSDLPVRLFARPEVHLCTLHAQAHRA